MLPQILDIKAKPHHNDQKSKNLQKVQEYPVIYIYIYIYLFIYLIFYLYVYMYVCINIYIYTNTFLCILLEVNLNQTTMRQIEMSVGSGKFICTSNP